MNPANEDAPGIVGVSARPNCSTCKLFQAGIPGWGFNEDPCNSCIDESTDANEYPRWEMTSARDRGEAEMDAFLIEKFEKQGAKRIESHREGLYGAEFQSLDLLARAVAAVAWDLGEALIIVDELGVGCPEDVEKERALENAWEGLRTLMVLPIMGAWRLS